MPPHPIDIPITDTPPSRFDTVIECLLIALLIFMPLAFGVVHAWSEMVVIAIAAAISICLVLKLACRRDIRFVWSWTYLPIALFLLLSVIQLLPLPAAVVAAISPQTSATKIALLGDLPDADRALRYMTLSFYPHATKHDLRLLLAISTVFVAVVNIYRRRDQIIRLLSAIVLVGAAVGLLALLQTIEGGDRTHWFATNVLEGTFVNHSHFSQFMNLSIGAALGLLLLHLQELFHGSRRLRWSRLIERLAEPRARMVWLLIPMMVVGMATVILSMSRAGAISLLLAGSFTALVLASKRSLTGRGWIIALLALGAFVCVLYTGFDAVYDRLATMRGSEDPYDDRWEMLKDTSVIWSKFPLLGTGLGTYEVVYPMFERPTVRNLASHAENEYAQITGELGILGLLLMLTFLAMVWPAYARLVREKAESISIVAFGLGLGLLAVMIHSFSDFGQHLPANACLTAITCGLLVGLAKLQTKSKRRTVEKSTSQDTGAPAPAGRSWLFAPLLVALVAVWGWALFAIGKVQTAERHWQQAQWLEDDLRQEGWQASNQDYINLLSRAKAASKLDPDNIEYRHWLNVYRWRYVSRTVDAKTGELLLTEPELGFTQQIIDDLQEARRLCPTFGQTYGVIGQLELFVLNQPAGADHIRKGYELAPNDAAACFMAGLLDAREQKFDASIQKFGRALTLDPSRFGEIADVYIHTIDRPDLAVEMAADDIGRLFTVASLLSQETEHTELAEQARTRARQTLKAMCDKPDAPGWALGRMADFYRQDSKHAEAMALYRRALDRDYGQVHWRLGFARSLAAEGQVDQAIREAKLCLRLRPQFVAAKRLIEQLSVRVSE